MNELTASENSYLNVGRFAYDIINDLIEIGNQIKDNLGLRQSPIKYISRKQLYIGNIVGSISLNETHITIEPKIVSGSGTQGTAKRLLLERVIKCSANNLSSAIYYAKNSVADSDDLFSDVLAKYFLSTLSRALRSTKILQYEEKTERLNTIKGKLLVHKQLSQPLTDSKTWCKYKSMTQNNIFNQLLNWACRYLSEKTKSMDTKRKLLALSKEFVQNNDLLSVQAVREIKPLRQFAQYNEVISGNVKYYSQISR